MKLRDALAVDADVAAGRCVAMVLGDVEHNAVAADMHVERRGRVEPVFPVDLETEPIDIEFARLGFVEAAHDRHRAKMGQRHERTILPCPCPVNRPAL